MTPATATAHAPATGVFDPAVLGRSEEAEGC